MSHEDGLGFLERARRRLEQADAVSRDPGGEAVPEMRDGMKRWEQRLVRQGWGRAEARQDAVRRARRMDRRDREAGKY